MKFKNSLPQNGKRGKPFHGRFFFGGEGTSGSEFVAGEFFKLNVKIKEDTKIENLGEIQGGY